MCARCHAEPPPLPGVAPGAGQQLEAGEVLRVLSLVRYPLLKPTVCEWWAGPRGQVDCGKLV